MRYRRNNCLQETRREYFPNRCAPRTWELDITLEAVILLVLSVFMVFFGRSMLLPGLIPGTVTAAILFCNGIRLLVLALIILRLPPAT